MFNLKKIMAVLLIAGTASFFCGAQNNTAEAKAETESVQENKENLTDAQKAQNEIIFSDTETDDASAVQNSGTSGVFVFLRMILVLAIVVGAIYVIFRFFKKTVNPSGDKDPFLRKVSSVPLAVGKSVQIVTLIDKAYIIGVSDNGVNLIEKIDDKELINAMNLYADKMDNTAKPKNFAEVLELFMPSKGTEVAASGETGKTESGSKQKLKSIFGKKSTYDADTMELINSLKNKRMNGGE